MWISQKFHIKTTTVYINRLCQQRPLAIWLFFCIILTHGLTVIFFGSDWYPLPSLAGKPNMFILNACKRNRVIVSWSFLQWEKILQQNLLTFQTWWLFFPNISGFKSTRSFQHGSPFITQLCTTLSDIPIYGMNIGNEWRKYATIWKFNLTLWLTNQIKYQTDRHYLLPPVEIRHVIWT